MEAISALCLFGFRLSMFAKNDRELDNEQFSISCVCKNATFRQSKRRYKGCVNMIVALFNEPA